jgi:hypothetical protein
MKYLFISLVFLTSCEIRYDDSEPKYVDFGTVYYPIVTATDSCEYYIMKMSNGYTMKNYYYHYPQCSWCKKHK